jgi:predicted O-methyltransferase YrrM
MYRSIFTGQGADAETILHHIIKRCKPKVMVETGTCQGLSSLFFALNSDVQMIHTFDIEYSRLAQNIWNKFEVNKRITYHVCCNEEKQNIINGLHFDFAFIDGDHSYEGVMFDYNLVKNKCKSILFHDYIGHPESVKTFIDETFDKKQLTFYDDFVLCQL